MSSPDPVPGIITEHAAGPVIAVIGNPIRQSILSVDGNQYHGDPDIYGVDVPYLRYSVGTIGPSLRAMVGPGIGLQVDSGFSFQRRFEFFDGDDEENLSDYSLKNSAFLRVTLQYGG